MPSSTWQYAALALAVLPGCARDTDLPPVPTVPVIGSFAPEEAFADELLRLQATGVDPDPELDEVIFPGGIRSRGLALEEGALVVRVPSELPVFEGPLALATPLGESAPAGHFYWRGVGRPMKGTPVGEIRLLHQPRSVAVIDGEPFVPSRAFSAVVSRGRAIVLPVRPSAMREAAGSLLVALEAPAGGLRLMTPLGDVLASAAGSVQLLAVPPGKGSTPLAFSVGEAGGELSVSSWLQRDDSLIASFKHTLPLAEATGLVALDSRRVIVAGRSPHAAGFLPGLLLLDVTGAEEPSWIPAPGAAPAGPLALLPGAEEAVAVALADGTVSVLNLGASPTFGDPVPTGGATAVGDLVAYASDRGPQLLASRADGVVVALEGDATAWVSGTAGQPSALALDGGRLFVGFADRNAVDVLDADTGRLVDRISFEAGLGGVEDCRCGAVAPYDYVPGGTTAPERILILARRMGQLLSVDASSLALNEPIPLDPAGSAPIGLVLDPARTPWVLHERDLGRVREDQEVLVARELPEPPIALAFAPDGTIVAGAAGSVWVLRGNPGSGYDVEGGGPLPGGGHLEHLEMVGENGVLLLWTADAGVEGGLFTIAGLAAGSAPTRMLELPTGVSGFLGATRLRDALQLLFSDGPGGPVLVPVSSEAIAGAPLPSPITRRRALGPTADGRFFTWAPDDAVDSALVVVAGPEEGEPPYVWINYRVDGPPGAPVTDPSGAWLFVPLPTLDRVVILE